MAHARATKIKLPLPCKILAPLHSLNTCGPVLRRCIKTGNDNLGAILIDQHLLVLHRHRKLGARSDLSGSRRCQLHTTNFKWQVIPLNAKPSASALSWISICMVHCAVLHFPATCPTYFQFLTDYSPPFINLLLTLPAPCHAQPW